jgi:tetratricopeptide (TPR) repeat protein
MALLIAAFAATARGGFRWSPQDSGVAVECEVGPGREMATIERCLALNPRDIELMLDLGSLYEAAGRFDRAEELYRRGLSVDSRDGDLHIRLGEALFQRGDVSGANNEVGLALMLQPHSSRALALRRRLGEAGDR